MPNHSLHRTITVAAGIIWCNNRFLASLRPEGAPFAGYWELPGGKLEPGESAESALSRELFEELGINATECSFLAAKEHLYGDEHLRVNLYFYEVGKFAGDPAPREGQSIRWLLPSEARTMNFLPADQEIIESLALSHQCLAQAE